MVTLQTAENALKTLYLGVVSDQLNTNINPLLAKIKQTSSDVWGKEIRKLAPYGINGGIGAGTEDGDLPTAAANNYAQFVLTLKNLYGTIEISDKAIRASSHNSGAFVDLLNAEMEGLLKASAFNFGRMLYGDGSGVLANVTQAVTASNVVKLDSVRNVIEGLVIDFHTASGKNAAASGKRIVTVDRATNTITLSSAITCDADSFITVQGSHNLELTGLGAIFSETGTLYGLDKETNKWLVPHITKNVGTISDGVIQKAIDHMEEVAGSTADFIICSAGVKRAYQEYLSTYKRNVDIMDLKGGFKALSYNGIPLISDRFVPNGTMYILNSKQFNLHQLCDWRWLEGEDGKIIKQIANKPVYSATLVKYADLICNQPTGQAMLSGITEA